MPDKLWTPSDEILLGDPIARAKVQHPHPAVDLAGAGLALPDSEDDDVLEARAAAVLAELEPDDDGDAQEGTVDDDDAVDDEDDPTPGDDV